MSRSEHAGHNINLPHLATSLTRRFPITSSRTVPRSVHPAPCAAKSLTDLQVICGQVKCLKIWGGRWESKTT